jgi:hypothetical protein
MAVNTTKWQIGLTVGTLITLPEPDQSIDRPLGRIGGTQTSILGSNTTQTFAFKRSWTIAWTNLSDTDAPTVLQFWDPNVGSPGVYKGVGPFVFNDPDSTYQPTVNITQMDENAPVNGRRTVTATIVEV